MQLGGDCGSSEAVAKRRVEAKIEVKIAVMLLRESEEENLLVGLICLEVCYRLAGTFYNGGKEVWFVHLSKIPVQLPERCRIDFDHTNVTGDPGLCSLLNVKQGKQLGVIRFSCQAVF